MKNFCHYDNHDRYNCEAYDDYERQRECAGYVSDEEPTNGVYWCHFYALHNLWQACDNANLREEARLEFKLEEL